MPADTVCDGLRREIAKRPSADLRLLIGHPEGRFLVDTDTARNSVPGYLPRWNPFSTKQVVIKVAPFEELGPRLQAMANAHPRGGPGVTETDPAPV